MTENNHNSTAPSVGGPLPRSTGLVAFYDDELGKDFVNSTIAEQFPGLPVSGLYSMERIRQFARETRFDPDSTDSFEAASSSVEKFAIRITSMLNRSASLRDTASSLAGSRCGASVVEVSSGPGSNATLARGWGTAGPPTPSTTQQAPKRPRPAAEEDQEAVDSRLDIRGAAFVEGLHPSAASGNDPYTPDDTASPEMRHFAPLLVAINMARRKLCAAVERIGSQLVDIPPEKVLSVSESAFARAKPRPLWNGAVSSETFQGEAQDLFRAFSEARGSAAELQRATSRAVRLYWLANQTQGANWDTVAQLVYRERQDNHMSKVVDGYVPIATWDERVAIAMKETHQERHLAKDGTPLGPLCPELQRRRAAAFRRIPPSLGQPRGKTGKTHQPGPQFKGRSKGKENARPSPAARHARGNGGGGSRPPAAGRPATAGAAAAAQAAAAAGGQ